MNELDVQRLLIDAALDLGGFAFKAANRFRKGVLDLSVQLPRRPHCYVEVKFARRFVNGDEAPFNLTQHQREFIVDTRRAGGHAGWVMVVGAGNGRYVLDCGVHAPPPDVRLRLGDHWFFKERGGAWPIQRVVDTILAYPREQASLALPKRLDTLAPVSRSERGRPRRSGVSSKTTHTSSRPRRTARPNMW